MLDREEGREGGRESDGRGRRQALIKNEQRAVEEDGHHPACRERERGPYFKMAD